MKIYNLSKEIFSEGWKVDRLPVTVPPGIKGLAVTLFFKATFRLHPDRAPTPWEEKEGEPKPDPPSGDLMIDGDARKGLGYASDYVSYKPCAEFTAIGTAYPPAGEEKKFFAKMRVGDCSRTLGVVGERRWVYGPAGLVEHLGESRTPPKATRLSYDNAWGAPDDPLNPLGCGKVGQKTHLLELPESWINLRNINAMPAVFAPMPPDSPLRKSKLGTYGPEWVAKGWPWLPSDFDFSYFNAAPPGQWIKGYLRGDEELEFGHMHPQVPHYTTRLPGLRPRCFVNTITNWRVGLPPEEEQREFSEVPMHLDTLWADMDKEKLVLVWRGRTPIRSRKLRDLESLLILAEPLKLEKEERGPEFYKTLFELASNPPKPVPTPEELAARSEAAEAAAAEHEAELKRIRAKAAEMQEAMAKFAAQRAEADAAFDSAVGQVRHQMQEAGISLPAATGGASSEDHGAVLSSALDTLGKSLENEAIPQESRASAEVMLASLRNLDPAALDPSEVIAKIEALKASIPSPPVSFTKSRILPGDGGEETPDEGFPRTTEALPINSKVDPAKLREFVAGREGGGGLSNLDLSGLDFSGLDLSGANFRGSNLKGASFLGCPLVGADFTLCDLSEADLSRANMQGANLSSADLAGAVTTKTLWAESTLAGAKLAGLTLRGADFSGAVGERADFSGADLSGSNFRGAKLNFASFRGATLEGADFSEAGLFYSDFIEVNARGIRMNGADLTRIRAGKGSDFTGASMRRVKAPKAFFEKAILDRVDFLEADLTNARFCECPARGTNFDRCHLTHSNFQDALMNGSILTNANLLGSDFARADLTGARLDGSNLYGAALRETILLNARWDNAVVEKTALAGL